MVVTPPTTHLIQGNEKHVGALQCHELQLSIGPAGNGIAKRARQAVQHRWLPLKDSTKPTGSARPRNDNAASCSPTAHPSVRSCNAATDASGRSSPVAWVRNAAVSAGVKRRSAERNSAS